MNFWVRILSGSLFFKWVARPPSGSLWLYFDILTFGLLIQCFALAFPCFSESWTNDTLLSFAGMLEAGATEEL